MKAMKAKKAKNARFEVKDDFGNCSGFKLLIKGAAAGSLLLFDQLAIRGIVVDPLEADWYPDSDASGPQEAAGLGTTFGHETSEKARLNHGLLQGLSGGEPAGALLPGEDGVQGLVHEWLQALNLLVTETEHLESVKERG